MSNASLGCDVFVIFYWYSWVDCRSVATGVFHWFSDPVATGLCSAQPDDKDGRISKLHNTFLKLDIVHLKHSGHKYSCCCCCGFILTHRVWSTGYKMKTWNLSWIFHHRLRAKIFHHHVFLLSVCQNQRHNPSMSESRFKEQLFKDCGGWNALLVGRGGSLY